MTRASRSSRVVLVALVALTTIGVSAWRTALGLHYLPGLFTVVFVPLSVAGFIALDPYVGFSLAEWVAVCGLVMAHLVLSVPVLPKPLYYVGGHIVRPDHFVHLFAGGLVAWLLDRADGRDRTTRHEAGQRPPPGRRLCPGGQGQSEARQHHQHAHRHFTE